MVEQTSAEYSAYLKLTDLNKEIGPLCTSVDDLITRLSEFEAMINLMQNQVYLSSQDKVPDIQAMYKEMRESLFTKIDKLEAFVDVVNQNVDDLEKVVSCAEEELNGQDFTTIRTLLRPFFLYNKPMASPRSPEPTVVPSTQNCDNQFSVFKTDDYFQTSLEPS